MKSIRYHEAAEIELLSVVGYLEMRQKGLGRRFLAEIKNAESFIERFPHASEEIRPGIRKRLLRKFRYALIYVLEQDEILILAVAHTSRRPGYWTDRVERR